MKHLITTFAVGFAFLAGVGVGICASYLYLDHAANAAQAEAEAGKARENRYKCVEFHQAALCQRAGLYYQKFGHWPTNVQDLVEAHFLPAYSQVHCCPSEVQYSDIGRGVAGDFSFVDKDVPAAYYTHSPYRFRLDGTNFAVVCTLDTSHTHRDEYEK